MPRVLLPEVVKLTLAFTKSFIFVDIEEDLSRRLVEAGFKVPEEGSRVLRVSQDGKQTLARRWAKDGVDALYDPERSFLSAEGTELPKVAEAFSDLRRIAREALGEKFAPELKWGEVNVLVRAIGTKPSLEVLSQRGPIDLAEKVGRGFGFDLRPMSMGFFFAEKGEWERRLVEITDWVHVSVEPFIPNPTYYIFRVVCRLKDVEKVEAFGKDLERKLDELLAMLEG